MSCDNELINDVCRFLAKRSNVARVPGITHVFCICDVFLGGISRTISVTNKYPSFEEWDARGESTKCSVMSPIMCTPFHSRLVGLEV